MHNGLVQWKLKGSMIGKKVDMGISRGEGQVKYAREVENRDELEARHHHRCAHGVGKCEGGHIPWTISVLEYC